jgi:hypothetical protein
MKACLLTVLIPLLLCSCSSENKPDFISFNELSASDSLKWHNKLMDAIHAEMVDSARHIKFDLPIIICEPRPGLQIRLNDHQYMVHGEISGDIPGEMRAYYFTNREFNDVANAYPMYTHLTRKEIDAGIAQSLHNLEEVRTQKVEKAMLEYHELILKEWTDRKSAIEILNMQSLPEIHGQFHLELSGRYANPDIKRQVMRVIGESYYWMRDELAQQYFGKSYLELYYLAQTRGKKKDLDRMLALRFLLPINVVDEEYCRAHGCCGLVDNTPPPEIFIESGVTKPVQMPIEEHVPDSIDE